MTLQHNTAIDELTADKNSLESMVEELQNQVNYWQSQVANNILSTEQIYEVPWDNHTYMENMKHGQ